MTTINAEPRHKVPHYIYAKDWPPEYGLFIRKFYERKTKGVPGRTHIILKFPRQELIDEATEHLRAWLETRGVWVIVINKKEGQHGHE